uniref:Uncharacterized protein n=1 Tax=Geospiza parvula TaxID=87175 RepID=A0A8C3NC67_GEOPR
PKPPSALLGLTAALQPTHLEVRDDSPRHGGPPGAETHFGVLVVSGLFAGLSPLQRHRLVHEALRAELAGPLHALQVTARTPEQWRGQSTRGGLLGMGGGAALGLGGPPSSAQPCGKGAEHGGPPPKPQILRGHSTGTPPRTPI